MTQMTKSEIEKTIDRYFAVIKRDIGAQWARQQMRWRGSQSNCSWTLADLTETNRVDDLVQNIDGIALMWEKYKEACNDADDRKLGH